MTATPERELNLDVGAREEAGEDRRLVCCRGPEALLAAVQRRCATATRPVERFARTDIPAVLGGAPSAATRCSPCRVGLPATSRPARTGPRPMRSRR